MLTPLKVLLVEDNNNDAKLLIHTLEEGGFEVKCVQVDNEADYISSLKDNPSIVLSDYSLPRFDGLRALLLLKEQKKDIPFIVISGAIGEEFAVELMKAGAQDYIMKDNLKRLPEAIKRELEEAEGRKLRKRAEEKIKEQNIELKQYIEHNQTLKYADLMKSQFLASVSHELRTPLSAIIGFSEMLKDEMIGNLTPKQKEYSTDIYLSGQHLLELINDILDLSKIEAGKMTLDLQPVEVSTQLRDAWTLFKEKAESRSLQLNIDVQSGLSEALFDPRRLKQIIYNLLSNAVKYTPDGGNITLRANVNSVNHTLEMSVINTGKGISEENIKKLFQPFVQIRERGETQEGTGLGLTIVKHLVELHGGTIQAVSELESGTVFTVKLPFHAIENQQILSTEKAKARVITGTPKALVVEDDPKAAEIMRLELTNLGIEMIWKTTAEEALIFAEENPPDLLILDIMLPGMSGLEMLNKIRELKNLSDIPVVIVSVAGLENKSNVLGSVDVLNKPISKNDLVKAIRKALPESSNKTPLKILAVDDDPTIIELLEHYLSEIDCHFLSASGGLQALDSISLNHPDVIILDLLMPDITGFGVIHVLKKAPATENIPIIILTSKNLTEEEKRLLSADTFMILKKNGITGDRFRQEIQRALFLQ